MASRPADPGAAVRGDPAKTPRSAADVQQRGVLSYGDSLEQMPVERNAPAIPALHDFAQSLARSVHSVAPSDIEELAAMGFRDRLHRVDVRGF